MLADRVDPKMTVDKDCAPHPRPLDPTFGAVLLLRVAGMLRLLLLLPSHRHMMAHYFIRNAAMDGAVNPERPLYGNWLARELLSLDNGIFSRLTDIGALQPTSLSVVILLAKVFSRHCTKHNLSPR